MGSNISLKSLFSLIVLYIIYTPLIIGQGVLKSDYGYVYIILGFVISIPMMLLSLKVLQLQKDKDLFTYICENNKKSISRVFISLITLYFILIGVVDIKIFSSFTKMMIFPSTPEFIFIIFILVLVFFGIYKDFNVLGKLACFLFIFAFMFYIFATITSIFYIDIKSFTFNIGGEEDIFLNLLTIFNIPFLQLFAFNFIGNKVENKKSLKKVYFFAIAVGVGIIFIQHLSDILVLGHNLIKILPYPSYSKVGVVSVGNFIARFEILYTFIYISSLIVKVGVCFYIGSLGVYHILKPLKRLVFTLGGALSLFLFMDIGGILSFVNSILYIAPCIIIPVFIYIYIKSRKRKEFGDESSN